LQLHNTTSIAISIDDAIRAIELVLGSGDASTSVTATTTFDELGLSSLDFAEVLVALEEIAGRAVDIESISEDLVTVADLTKLRLAG
jgi:acyl carrier protein